MYGLFTEKYEEGMSADLYKWVYAGYVSYIKFVFYSSLGMELKFGLKYRVNSEGGVSRDDDAGNIPYVTLPQGTQFQVLVIPNHAWGTLNYRTERLFLRHPDSWVGRF